MSDEQSIVKINNSSNIKYKTVLSHAKLYNTKNSMVIEEIDESDAIRPSVERKLENIQIYALEGNVYLIFANEVQFEYIWQQYSSKTSTKEIERLQQSNMIRKSRIKKYLFWGDEEDLYIVENGWHRLKDKKKYCAEFTGNLLLLYKDDNNLRNRLNQKVEEN